MPNSSLQLSVANWLLHVVIFINVPHRSLVDAILELKCGSLIWFCTSDMSVILRCAVTLFEFLLLFMTSGAKSH